MDVSESDWIRFEYIIQFAWIVTLGGMDPHSPKVITFDEVALIPRSPWDTTDGFYLPVPSH